MASVLGREFQFNQLHGLVDDISEDRLLDVLDEALRSKVIEEMPQAVGHYQFTHALMQETLTEELSLTRRVRLHSRIATSLEELYGAEAEARAPELAYHFVQAEAVLGSEKLVKYSSLAGAHALANYAYEDALEYFQRALSAKEGQAMDSETARLHFGLAKAQEATSSSRDNLVYLNIIKAFNYYVESGDVSAAITVARYPVGNLPMTDIGRTELTSRALALVSPESIDAGFLLAFRGLGVFHEKRDYETAQESFDKALAIAEREQDSALEIRVLANAIQVDLWNLRLQDLPARGMRAMEVARSIGDPQVEVQAAYETARALAATGDLKQARLISEGMLSPAEKLRSVPAMANALWLNGSLCRAAGDWEDARAFFKRMLAIRTGPRVLTDLSVLDHLVGDIVQGEIHIAQLLENPTSGFA